MILLIIHRDESVLYACSSTMAASSVQDQDLIVLGRRPQAAQQAPQQQQAGRSAAADPLQARMQQAMRSRPDGSLEDIQACLVLHGSVYIAPGSAGKARWLPGGYPGMPRAECSYLAWTQPAQRGWCLGNAQVIGNIALQAEQSRSHYSPKLKATRSC